MYLPALGLCCGMLFANQGSNPGSLHWEHRVSVSGPPEKLPILSSNEGSLVRKAFGILKSIMEAEIEGPGPDIL